MKKILVLFAIILVLAVPVSADINQKANLNGGNTIEVKVDQMALNYGSGDINQDIGVHVTGNYQMTSQDNIVLISDDYEGNVNNNNTIKGLNLIRVDLNQYGDNTGSGNIAQGINVLVDDNVQVLDQDVIVLVG